MASARARPRPASQRICRENLAGRLPPLPGPRTALAPALLRAVPRATDRGAGLAPRRAAARLVSVPQRPQSLALPRRCGELVGPRHETSVLPVRGLQPQPAPSAVCALGRRRPRGLRWRAPLGALPGLMRLFRHVRRPRSATTRPQAAIGLAAPTSCAAQRRHLNVHEHVGMELMRKFDIPVPRGSVATTPEEAEEVHRSHLAGGGEKALNRRLRGQWPAKPPPPHSRLDHPPPPARKKRTSAHTMGPPAARRRAQLPDARRQFEIVGSLHFCRNTLA